MKKLLSIAVLALAFVTFAGCRAAKTIVEREVVIERDTLIITDSVVSIVETIRTDTLIIKDSVVIYMDAPTGTEQYREKYREVERRHDERVTEVDTESKERERVVINEREAETKETEPPNVLTWSDRFWICTGKALAPLFAILAIILIIKHYVKRVI